MDRTKDRMRVVTGEPAVKQVEFALFELRARIEIDFTPRARLDTFICVLRFSASLGRALRIICTEENRTPVFFLLCLTFYFVFSPPLFLSQPLSLSTFFPRLVSPRISSRRRTFHLSFELIPRGEWLRE